MKAREIKNEAKDLITWAISELENAEVIDPQFGDDIPYKSVFLGTVFNIMPSGKYYTPWARSNVDGCPRCKEKGCLYCGGLGSREAFEDQIMSEYLESLADDNDIWIESGEGDPCDLFACQSVE